MNKQKLIKTLRSIKFSPIRDSPEKSKVKQADKTKHIPPFVHQMFVEHVQYLGIVETKKIIEGVGYDIPEEWVSEYNNITNGNS